jgi:hypothetical protein
MLDLKVSIENDKVVVQGLQDLADRFPAAIKRGLKRIAAGIFGHAYQWLSGAGANVSNVPGGGYPIPVRTGHLRRSLDWLAPGESKSGDAGTFRAGDDEVVIFDSASYAPAVFLGRGSSAAYGPRDAVKDALDLFNHGDKIRWTLGEEIRKEINAHVAGGN